MAKKRFTQQTYKKYMAPTLATMLKLAQQQCDYKNIFGGDEASASFVGLWVSGYPLLLLAALRGIRYYPAQLGLGE